MGDQLPYEVDRRIWGGTVVTYQCPHCAHHLESPLSEAGTKQIAGIRKGDITL